MKQLVLPPASRQGDRVELRGRDHHYLAHVRRVAEGDRLKALDGEQALVLQVRSVQTDRLVLDVVEQTATGPVGPALTLFAFLLKARKLDEVIRQAAQAGVSTVVPVSGDHGVARADEGADKTGRWQAIAREATQQAGSAQVCRVAPVIRSDRVPEVWAGAGPLLVFHEKPLDNGSLHGYLFSRPEAVALVVGPEGGLSAAELDLYRRSGGLPVWLGPRVLRAETASVYAVAAVNTVLQEASTWTIRS